MGGGWEAQRAPYQPVPFGKAEACLSLWGLPPCGRPSASRGVRLSDYLSQTKPFQILLEAKLYVLTPNKPIVDLEPLETFPFVTLNLRRAEAVAEAPGEAQDPRLTLFG